MKILLISDIPPTQQYTAGIVLNQLGHYLNPADLCLFIVKDAHLPAFQIDSFFALVPTMVVVKPIEDWALKLGKYGWWGYGLALIMEQIITKYQIPKLVKQLIKFTTRYQVDAIWIVLQGQTMIRIGAMLGKRLKLPIATEIWDPPTWWLRDRQVDRFTKKEVLAKFDEAIKASKICATASPTMAENYEKKYGVKTVVFLPTIYHRKESVKDIPIFRIGFAGQIYALKEFSTLISALNELNWHYHHVKIILRVLSYALPNFLINNSQIEFYPWQTQEKTIELLKQCDLLYCPYWFDRKFDEVIKLSFPSKLSTYLSLGKLVLFHGPKSASPAIFLEKYKAGLMCYSKTNNSIKSIIKKVIKFPENFALQKGNALKAFNTQLSPKKQRQQFIKFMSYLGGDL